MTPSEWPDLSGKTILQVIPDLAAGGAERTTVEIAEAVTLAGGTALVVSEGGRLEPSLIQAGGEMMPLPVASKNPATVITNALKLKTMIKSHGIDLIHARSRAPAWSAYHAARSAQIPFVTTYHGAYSGKTSLKRYYNSVMAKGELVIANSDWTAAHVEETHGIDPDKIVTIPRGVDFDAFDPGQITTERLQALRSAWALDPADKRLILLLPGRLTRWKGQALTIAALGAMSSEECERLHLVLAGDAQGRTSYVAELEDAILTHGLGGSVSIVGHCEDMPAAYHLADIVMAPSTRPEAFGRVAAEASAMGRAVIVADHGGQRETVIEGQTGTRAEPGSVSALTACIRTLVSLTPDARAAMGEAGKTFVEQHFSKKQLQTKTLGVYQRLLQS
ncbi:MAG: glycosyltransferase family 4 protein [Henriciella sp.]|nr:glycosyltransferase family 4 protein [Henriciella sp.]